MDQAVGSSPGTCTDEGVADKDDGTDQPTLRSVGVIDHPQGSLENSNGDRAGAVSNHGKAPKRKEYGAKGPKASQEEPRGLPAMHEENKRDTSRMPEAPRLASGNRSTLEPDLHPVLPPSSYGGLSYIHFALSRGRVS